jgi:hypothetical protein|tara:strand:- start:940 stop:1335 length:396 start_codon:yes stop_codon:yes gene_type:complete
MQMDLFVVHHSTNPHFDTKMCKKCNIEKPITEYRLYRRATGDKDSRDSKCKTCSSYQTEIAKALRKVAPEYKGFCECCSKEYTNPVLDHCHDTESFRGWLCPPCNLGIGILGDRLKDVRNALMYLERTNEK